MFQVSFKYGQFTGDSKGAKGVTSGVKYYLWHLIEAQIVYQIR